MSSKQFIPAKNCHYHLSNGFLTVLPAINFTALDLLRVYKQARLHAKFNKVRHPERMNNPFDHSAQTIPTLTDIVQ